MTVNHATSLQVTCGIALESDLCFSLRRLSRELRLSYDAMLQPVGITSSQLILLIAICNEKCTTMRKLADKVGADRTVLSRTLRPLESEQLIQVISGADRRTREVTLTDKGTRKVEEAYPYWLAAQNGVERKLGSARVKSLLAELEEALKLV